MEEDFWGSSSVSKAANRQNIFDMDEDDPMAVSIFHYFSRIRYYVRKII